MAKLNRVATLYAKAFLASLKEKELETVIEELKIFSGMLAQSADLRRVVASPMLTEEVRLSVLKDILAKAKASPATVRVLSTITEKRRLEALEGITQTLEDMKLTREGTVPIYVASGLAMDAGSRKKLEAKFESVLKKKVKANYSVEPSLIAGVQVTANGRSYEGSMAGWLNRLNEEFSGGIHS